MCNKSFSKTAMKKHLESSGHSSREGSGYPVPVGAKLFTILVEGSFFREYWMYLEVPANTILRRLDNFLRDTWVECCGHMSMFVIDGKKYFSETDEYFKEDLSMHYILDKVLSQGKKFSYEYDFGSPTRLDLKVVDVREIKDSDSSVVILARNELPLLACNSCGKIAAYICRQCGGNNEGWVCEGCSSYHECGNEMLLPVVNSPRVGVCGYTGMD